MNRIAAALVAATLSLTAAGALASEGHERLDAQTERAIREKLAADGYDVRKIKAEDGLYEAYVLRDGKRAELYLDRDLNLVRTKDAD
ncbi:MAG: PepSY domain-containing protein [Alphaproteobacteria bacterium]|nr:PepSY domain-containing protein [Alphaproteobacteria bacterium]MCB9929759.1 PepSY domain-containing protein [Alphaproteobacteria bacterium]